MKAKDLRKLNENDLKAKLASIKQELHDLSFDVVTGTEKDYSQIKKKKKTIARIISMLKMGDFSKETDTKSEEKPQKDSKNKAKSDKITKSKSKSTK